MCDCGEGCERYSCFVGTDCKCCDETYGPDRYNCDCHDCRSERWRKERENDTLRAID